MGDCSYNLEGKRCLVTGAARGLGSEIAGRFLEAGASVVLSDINIQGVRETARKLDPEGKRAFSLQLNVTDEAQVIEAVAEADTLLDGIDVLVNVAGILKHLPIDRMSLEDFTSIINVNLVGTFLMCREAVKVMKRMGGGKIVNIASLGGVTGRPGVGVNYAASKAGVIGLSRTLAKEVGKDNIYVNAVNPGPIMTELTRNVPEQTFASWNAGRAVEKNGLPEDVAAAVLFLASDQSDWITGVSLNVNGGIFI